MPCAELEATYVTRAAWQIILEGSPVRPEGYTYGHPVLGFRLQQVRLPKPRVLRLPSALIPLEKAWHSYAVTLVACDDTVYCGYLAIQLQADQFQAVIARFLVDDALRGRGVGTALLRAAQAWAFDQGVVSLLAHVPVRNVPGVMFYQQRGFRICGVCEHFYPTREDALLLMQAV